MGRYYLDSRGALKNKKIEWLRFPKAIEASRSINIPDFYSANYFTPGFNVFPKKIKNICVAK
jgi:hypothetical protein